jgi:hypothetical protein
MIDHCPPILQEVKEMKEKMEREVSQQLDSRELLLNQREAELTNLQVSNGYHCSGKDPKTSFPVNNV